jgi:hypothetical protein
LGAALLRRDQGDFIKNVSGVKPPMRSRSGDGRCLRIVFYDFVDAAVGGMTAGCAMPS